jgi:hypothetical protein
MGKERDFEAILAKDEILQKVSFPLADSRIVTLSQGLSMIPLTGELQELLSELDNAAAEDEEDENEEESWETYLPRFLYEHLLDLSIQGPVAFIFSEVWACDLFEVAIVWHEREIVFELSGEEKTVAQALRLFGVEKGDFYSEAHAVGLWERDFAEEWVMSDDEWQRHLEEEQRKYEDEEKKRLEQQEYEELHKSKNKKWWQFWI